MGFLLDYNSDLVTDTVRDMRKLLSVVILLLATVLIFAMANTAYAVIGDANACSNGYNKGFADGQNHPFDQSVFSKHSQTYANCYQNGFMKGCLSVKGNTKNSCNTAEDAG